ncbi:MAG: DUF5916 domain-containing protein [Bacteroidota bacterium]
MKQKLLLVSFCLIGTFLFSQSPAKKEYTATRVSHPPKINGLLDDSCWMNIPIATDFIQTSPNPGNPSFQKTEVKVVYDNSAIYVAAMMYDTAPDSILHELSKRDNVENNTNTDAFAIILDTYRDGVNGFAFEVSAADVQTDAKFSAEQVDGSWNAVWESKTRITNNGWIAEFKIPYSAIRFPKIEQQEWGINFYRIIFRKKEISGWNPIKPEVYGIVNQAGILKNINNIKSPFRLSFSPYVSVYADNYSKNNSYSINGGADIKYGINESFTMDMMLVPDFNQVRSDDEVLNLSPIETYYYEQRPFFTEGTELFNRANIFYSRRIGSKLLGFESVKDKINSNEIIVKNPSSSQLYNATKISGRTKNKLGIGFFNAVTAPTRATIKDTISYATRNILTNPLTNYNVFVLDQGMKNNSYISLINTNVSRNGNVYDANATGTQFKFVNKKNIFAFSGSGALTQLFFPDSTKLGYYYNVSLGKISGNYTIELTQNDVSTTYNPNDIGYIDRTNQFSHYLNQSYNIYKPFWIINKLSTALRMGLIMLHNPRKYTWFYIVNDNNIEFKNYFTWRFFLSTQPFNNFDYFETKTFSRYYSYTKNYETQNYFSSDISKPFSLSGSINYRIFNERNRTVFLWSINPHYRFNNKFNMGYSFLTENKNDNVGWVALVNDTIIFGVRDLQTYTNTIESNYIFKSNMSFSLRVYHYWSQVKYKSYFAVNDVGKSAFTSYNLNNDINFNAFNIYLAFIWQFLPGSEMSIVWKNIILTERQELISNYFNDFNNTISAPQQNSFSIKILYYLDYQSVKKNKQPRGKP